MRQILSFVPVVRRACYSIPVTLWIVVQIGSLPHLGLVHGRSARVRCEDGRECARAEGEGDRVRAGWSEVRWREGGETVNEYGKGGGCSSWREVR